MRVLVVLALVAVALASVPRQPRTNSRDWLGNIVKHDERRVEESSFRAEREYRFVYNGQLATGIPGASRQHAVTRVQAVVALVFKTNTQVLMKLTHVRFGKMNDEVPQPRQMLPFDATEEIDVAQDLQKQLLSPVLFKYTHGMITDLVFDGEEKPWSANIKRGVLNMLQVNVKQHGRTDMNEEQRLLNGVDAPQTPENDFFTCQERTLEGDCETAYTITQQPSLKDGKSEQVLNVTKSINFEKCRLRPDIRYNYRFGESCNTCDRKFEQDEKVLESSTVARFNISGTIDAFLIESVKVQSQYMFAPVNEQANIIATYVHQKLELVQAGPIQSRIEEPTNVQQSDSHMIYSPDWDIKKERFFMDGDADFLGASPYAAIANKPEFVGQILTKLISYISDEQQQMEQEGPRQLSRLVKALRMCTEEELLKVHQDFYETSGKIDAEHHQKVKDILVDALALAGTKNTIQHLMEKTKDRKVHPVKAALAIKALVNSRVVSEKHVDMVLELCRHQVAQRSAFLRQSCYLTVGSMMNALCLDNEDKLAVEFKTQTQKLCPVQLKQKYVKMLVDMFEQSSTQYDKVLSLKTLANAGIDMSIFELEKIIKNIGLGAPHQPIVRSQAIDALRQLRSVMPRKIQKILMPIYKNQLELPEIRMTAVAQIMQTQPERSVLDQIAEQLITERSQQVVAIVYTMMRTLANSTNPCEKRVAEDLQLSLRHARSLPLWSIVGKSKYIHMTAYSTKYNAGVTLNLGAILTNDSFLPKEVMAGIDSALGGQWHKNVFQFGMVQQNGDKLIQQLLGHQGLLVEKSLDQLLTRGKRASSREQLGDTQQQSKSYLRQLYKTLGVSGRRSHAQPTAMMYMRFRDQDYAFLPLDIETMPETIQQLVQNDRIDVQQIERFLSQGYHMNFHIAAFGHESMRKIPTTLGVPLVLTKKMPTIASIAGQIKATITPKDQVRRVSVQINVRPKITATNVIAIEAWTPILNTGVKVVESVQMNLPVHTELEVNAEQPQAELKWVIKTPKELVRLLAAQSRPVSFTRVWPKELRQYAEPEEKTVHVDEWDRTITFDHQFGKHAIGVNMRAQGQWHRTPTNALAGTPVGPFAGNNHVLITLSPGHEIPDEIVIKVDGSLFGEVAEDSLRPEMDKQYQTEEEQRFFQTEDDQEPKKRFVKFNEYSQSFRTKNPVEHALNIKMETRGGSVQRKAHVALKAQCGEEMRFCKWQMEVVRSPIPQRESQPWELKVKGQTLYPQMPTSLQQLQQLSDESLECSTKIEAEWGPQGRKDQFVHLKIQAKRSKQQIDLQRRSVYQQMYKQQQSSVVFSPVQQYDQLLKASMLTQYKLQAEYNLAAPLRNLTNEAFRLLQFVNLWNTDVAKVDVNNPEGKVYALITVDPRTLQYVNITVRMQHENVSITDMVLPVPITLMNVRRSSGPVRSVQQLLRAVTGRIGQAKCVVSSQRVKTFDQVNFRAPLTTCYSVLAKDCASDEPRFAVLMKKLSKDGEGKKMKIVSQENTIELIARQERFTADQDKPVQVKINGRDVDVEDEQTLSDHGHVVLRIRQQGQYISVDLPEVDVQVHFDGYAASIKVSQMYRNAQCGLCGHFDGEKGDEFRTADNRLTDDVRQFHRSFLHQDDECQIDEQAVDDDQQYQYRPFVWDRKDRSNSASGSGSASASREDSTERSQERSSSKQRSVERSSKSKQQSGEGNSQEQRSSKQQSAERSSSKQRSAERSNSKQRSAERSSSERRQKIWENSEEAFEKDVQEPRETTKVIEHTHEICFSSKPIRQCPKNTYPTKFDEDKTVTFVCLKRSDPEAHSLLRIAREHNVIRQLGQRKTTFTETVQIPVQCAKY